MMIERRGWGGVARRPYYHYISRALKLKGVRAGRVVRD